MSALRDRGRRLSLVAVRFRQVLPGLRRAANSHRRVETRRADVSCLGYGLAGLVLGFVVAVVVGYVLLARMRRALAGPDRKFRA